MLGPQLSFSFWFVPKPLTVYLETSSLDSNGNVAGQIEDPDGNALRFQGWAEFSSALLSLASRRDAEPAFGDDQRPTTGDATATNTKAGG